MSECIKKVDKRSRYLVFGFIRNEEKKLLSKHGNITFYRVPHLVIYQCLSYYYTMKFIYDKQQYKLDENDLNTIIKFKTILNYQRNCIFIGDWISKNVTTLKLKINKLDNKYGMYYYIGVVPIEWDVTKPITFCPGSYCYNPFGSSFCGKREVSYSLDKCLQDDVFSFIVDFPSSKLLYKIEGKNGKEKNGVIAQNVDMKNKKYKFAITMWSTWSSITILSIHS